MQLLNKTIKNYLLFSGLLILFSIPFSYYFLNRLIINEAKETLEVKRKKLHIRLSQLSGKAALNTWLQAQEYILLEPVPAGEKERDSIFRTTEYDLISKENIPYLVYRYSEPVFQQIFRVSQKESLVAERALIILVLKEQAGLLAFLLLGLLLINVRQSMTIWKPFYQTLNKLRQYEIDKNPALSFPPTRIKEFNDLNQAITQLTEKNAQVYKAQKEFTENAAHEIQTPLAIFQSKMDMLMQSKELNPDNASLIESLTDVSHRLSRINKSLLLLTKIENQQFIRKEMLMATDLLNELLQQFEGQFKDHHITCRVTHAAPVRVEANKSLMEILFSNMISNAIRHNFRGGTVLIDMRENIFSISNTGNPQEMDNQKIFERFSKSPKNPDSIGLGLAIVKKICDTCHFTIDYHYAAEQHCFKITL